jgi:hypothetical protein
LRADLQPDLAQHSPTTTQRRSLIVQREKIVPNQPCPTTLTGSWTIASRVSALSRNQDPMRTFAMVTDHSIALVENRLLRAIHPRV